MGLHYKPRMDKTYDINPAKYLPEYDALPSLGLEDFLEEKLATLSQILQDISQEIDHRENLSTRIIRAIDEHSAALKSELFLLDTWEPHTNRTVEAQRSSLERQLDQLEQEKRQEQNLAWQDSATLRKEIRQWKKQYQDLRQRTQLLR